MPEKHLSTRLIHAGEKKLARRLAATRSYPKVLPIHLNSVFSFEDVEALEAAYADPEAGYIYTRMGNPTHDAVCNILASAEGEGSAALVCASGMAAIILTIISQVKSGDHIIATPVLYGGVYDYFKNELPRFGVSVDFVDPLHEDLRGYFKPNTKILYTETITNPLMEVFDLREMADLAHEHGALLIVDNTFATPAICRPLDLGADISVYSATKYLCGHSDITAGAILASTSLIAEIKRFNILYGAMLGAFDAWLLARSLRTLDLRMARHSRNALLLAEYFAAQPAICKVH
ncbi:MAG: PLP-dependent aspartate aminotransferase family protein, partial [Symbiobacteriaceae bacterium]|nr:PLP-dependent aspartate aminotransferase family protein [Symbiobacteriaceae bacterium]